MDRTRGPASGLTSPGARYQRVRPPGPTSPGASGLRSPSVSSATDVRNGCFAHIRMTAGAKFQRYFKRLVHYRHMDFEFACWQMLYLLVSPQKVYKNFMYRKRTKDQWARDDPAFFVLLALALCASSLLFTLVLGLSVGKFVEFLIWAVFVDCIGTGVIVATVLWLISNRFMRKERDSDVEWGFAWDVHLNAFFPVLVTMHAIMPVLYAVYMKYNWILSGLCGNGLWFAAISYYTYITFLGYTALGFLRYTHIFLYPITFALIALVALSTLGVNLSNGLVQFYLYRIL